MQMCPANRITAADALSKHAFLNPGEDRTSTPVGALTGSITPPRNVADTPPTGVKRTAKDIEGGGEGGEARRNATNADPKQT